MNPHDELLNSAIIPWAMADDNVTGLAGLGSRVDQERTDEWADMDLLVLADEIETILDDDRWIRSIAPHWLALKHPGPFDGTPVRQVLFEGGLDFDIVPLTSGSLKQSSADPAIRALLGDGFSILVDKEGELEALPSLPMPEPLTPSAINGADYDFAVRDFLFQLVWATKHLRRGELWAAKDDVDCYMRTHLAEMLEWHAVAERPGTHTRSGGRHLEDWASERFVPRLRDTFATYDSRGIATALIEVTALFREVAQETAALLGFSYPTTSHEHIETWMRSTLDPVLYDR